MMAVRLTIFLTACLQQVFWHFGLSSNITLERCRPPDFPELGDYGPKRKIYFPGDVILYFCDPETYIGGNYRRLCMDNGDWSGDTPVCDQAVVFPEYGQTSTAEPIYANEASLAVDGNRETCSKTLGTENGAEWTAVFEDLPREVLRFMLYLPNGPVSYKVSIMKSDGSETSCGRSNTTIVINDWIFHNCVQPNNTGAVAVKVKSLTAEPLKLCEVMVHTLTDPTCVDPHFNVANGRLRLTRKTATLVCDEGYTRSPTSARKLDCIRTGVWSRRNLSCRKIEFGITDTRNATSNDNRPLETTTEPAIWENKESEDSEEIPQRK